MSALFFSLSAAIGVITVSVFVVDWKSISWSVNVLWFVLFFAIFFLVVTRFFLFAGLGILVFFLGVVFYSNYILDSWCMADEGAAILKIRLLSENTGENGAYDYEIKDWENNVSFYSSRGSRGQVILYRVNVPAVLFFIPGRNYIFPVIKGGDKGLENVFYYKVSRFASGKLKRVLIYRDIVDIPELRLLKSYSLSLNGGKIVIESSLLE